jgi:hypothetical protein
MAAAKVTPNASLAAHGAAPQRKINHLRSLWRGAKTCERLFQHPVTHGGSVDTELRNVGEKSELTALDSRGSISGRAHEVT